MKKRKLLKLMITAAVIIATLTAAAVILTFPASAAESYSDGYYTYSVTDGEATITGVDESISGDVAIPESLEGYPVTKINEYAFQACRNISSILIPETITCLGDMAFFECSNITSIDIPASITNIGHEVFSYCESLECITVDACNPVYYSNGNCIIEKASKTLIIGCKNSVIPADGSVINIGESAFSYCIGLEHITIPPSVTIIGANAFCHCEGLKSITLPSSIASISSGAFYFCSSLTNITIPEGVTNIDYVAFANCNSLKSVTIPNSVTNIGCNALSGCINLEQITVKENNPIYHSNGNCLIETASKILISGCKSSVIPSDGSVTSIGVQAFYGCRSLENITIPAGITSISRWAFVGCDQLKSITIPSSVSNIGDNTFSGCSHLETIFFSGSEKQWENMEKGIEWDYETGIQTKTGKYTVIYDYKMTGCTSSVSGSAIILTSTLIIAIIEFNRKKRLSDLA